MICPVCRNVMIVVEYKKIEFDYCTNCRGVWFDSGELELLLECLHLEDAKQLLPNLINSKETTTPGKARRCPACAQKMRETNLGQPPIPIDVCPRGDGLWFDGGELAQVMKQASKKGQAGTQGNVIKFLEEVFQVKE